MSFGALSFLVLPCFSRSDTSGRRCHPLTKILPVVVWPDISSPAQSFASVMNVPSNSCFPLWAFCSFCLGSFGASSGSFRQHRKANALHSKTMSRPARKVNILDRRKHHHLRTFKQSSAIGGSSVGGDSPQLQHCTHSAAISLPRGASISASHALISPKERHCNRTSALAHFHSRPRCASENHRAQSIRPDPIDRAKTTLRRPNSRVPGQCAFLIPTKHKFCRKNYFYLHEFSLDSLPTALTHWPHALQMASRCLCVSWFFLNHPLVASVYILNV